MFEIARDERRIISPSDANVYSLFTVYRQSVQPLARIVQPIV